MVPAPTSAAILAGGRARRFGGRDKSRLVVEGRPIVGRQLEVLTRVAHDIFIVGPRADLYEDLAVPVYADVLRDYGAIGGLFTALEVARQPLVLVVACDLPFLDDRLLGLLVERAAGRDGAWVVTPRGPEPLLACYRRAARDRVLARLRAGLLKAAALSDVLDLAAVDGSDLARFGPADRLLANLNTPDDYGRIESSR